ncbi:hypothetical protein ABEB36_006615 [Hypothenemus hampei]|uniref:C2H2-type domain-containing protein n=1 Tax=Hypothenemus hampei TaxID=57062 RepID=A0ABD1ERP0_HYPHA
MSNEEYNKKLESLQRYIPFLQDMMFELKAKGNREPQLVKIQSLYEMITDSNKKLKLETLNKCEEVLTNIYIKVNPQLRCKNASDKYIDLESPRSTPQSPSPPPDVVLTRPVTIPTEKIECDYKGVEPSRTFNSNRPKIDVYSNAVINKSSSQKPLVAPKLLDMSKPPITFDDLKTLEDDIHRKINDNNGVNYLDKSVDELQEVKKRLQLELRVEEFKSLEKETCGKHRRSSSSKSTVGQKLLTKNKIKASKETDIFGECLNSIDNKLIQEDRFTKDKNQGNKSTQEKYRHEDKNYGEDNKEREKNSTDTSAIVNSDQTTKIFKRLADKYNPKPKPKPSTESVVMDVDKTKSENTEASIKPPFNSQTIEQNQPVQLPEVIQRIFNKTSLMSDTSSAPLQSSTQKVNIDTKLNFQPPRFEPMLRPSVGSAVAIPQNLRAPLLPTPMQVLPTITPPSLERSFNIPRHNFDPPGTPIPDFEYHRNEYNTSHQSNFHQSNALFERRNYTPRNANFIGQPIYAPPVRPNTLKTSHRPSFPSDVDPQFIPERPTMYYQSQYRWNNPGDARSYREYKEMKERQERELRLAQERQIEVKDPRLQRENNVVRDPRLQQQPKELVEKTEVIIKDPRLIRNKSSERRKSCDEISRESSRTHDVNKFDRMYSTNVRSKEKGTDNETESFTSPLGSLYNAGEKDKTGRGYGVQNFKIPRKPRPDDTSKQLPVRRNTVELNEFEESNSNPPSTQENHQEDENSAKDMQDSEKIETSRIKVVVKQQEGNLKWNNSKLEANDFISEYDREVRQETENVKPDSTQQNEVQESPSTQEYCQKSEEKSNSEPSEQNILAHFFENLLKSKNKKDKKAALFSLIETFSDSFEDKEIDKIRKIIKVDEDEENEIGEDVANNQDQIASCTTEEPGSTLTTNMGGNTQIEEVSKLNEEESPKDEPVMESVGERIKNRKRVVTKPKKRFKSELDMLHEDIQDMFIRDGVLTATGKRMCRILKDDPNALICRQPNTTPSAEVPKKVRKKPGPKPKAKLSEEMQNSLKNFRVVLNKMPDNVTQLRKLRSRADVNYGEADVEEASSEGDLIEESDNDDDDDMEEQDKLSENYPKTRTTRRRKPAKWASGIIPKTKKRKSQPPSKESTPISTTPVPSSPRAASPNPDSPLEPDKNYYYDYGVKKKLQCKLCDFQGYNLTGHFLKEHPDSEVLCSRFPPNIAQEAIQDYLENENLLNNIISKKIVSKYRYCCRLCGYENGIPPALFYEHVSTHTGEYRHHCMICDHISASGRGMASHFAGMHPDQERKTYFLPCLSVIVYAFVCGECNFVQLEKKSVEDHVDIFHSGKKTKIYKVNMSSIVDPALIKNNRSEDSSMEEIEDSSQELLKKKPDLEGYKKRPGPKSKTMPYLEDNENLIEENEETVKQKPLKRSGPRSKTMSPLEGNFILGVKRPGPKSKTLPPSEINYIECKSENENSKSKPILGVKRSGPKSKTVPSELENVEPISVVRKKAGPKSKTEKGSIEEASTSRETRRKRKSSLDKLISDDSGDDLDAIITLSSRSSRAAKDKATAKLKTLMENSDTLVKKIPDKPDSAVVAHENSVDKVEKSPNKTELNVFTCDNDILQKIQEDRLKTMEELTKTIGSRPSSLNFVNQLSSRLEEEERLSQLEEKVQIKTEPVETPPYKFEESENIDVKGLKKPVLEEPLLAEPISTTFREDKPNSLFSNILEKLQEKVNEEQSQDNTESILVGELIKVTKYGTYVTFTCLVAGCSFVTRSQNYFQLHCKLSHQKLESSIFTCSKCTDINLDIKNKDSILEILFDHITECHNDFLSIATLLKTRRLSGDKLSVKSEESEESLECSEENPFPFKISNVVSLAEPQAQIPVSPSKVVPPLTPISSPQKTQNHFLIKEAKQSVEEMAKPRKSVRALQIFTENPNNLYKCPLFSCAFSTNTSQNIMAHLKAHNCGNSMVPCVYCDVKTPWEHVPTHIDIRHGNSRYCCKHCLYRAVVKEYVFIHHEQCHPELELVIIDVSINKISMKVTLANMTDYRKLCQPFRCPCCMRGDQALEFLYENEFAHHLSTVHKHETIPCGYNGCTQFLESNIMISHWASVHQVCMYQCASCSVSNKQVLRLFSHYAQEHPNNAFDVLLRERVPFDGIEIGYSDEAFKQLKHLKSLPENVMSTISVHRPSRVIHLETGTVTKSQEVVQSSLNRHKITPQLRLNSNVKFIMSSEKVLILPAAVLPSTAPINKVLTQTSTAAVTGIPPPRDPVKIGDMTIYPDDSSGVEIPSTSTLNTSTTTVFSSNSDMLVHSNLGNCKKSPEEVSINKEILHSALDTILDKEDEETKRKSSINPPPLVFLSSPVCEVEQRTVEDDSLKSFLNKDVIEDAVTITSTLNLPPDCQLMIDEDANNSKASDVEPVIKISSDDDSDSGQKRRGLTGYQLFRCKACNLSFGNVKGFKLHVSGNIVCKKTGFICVHCEKTLKTVRRLVEHVMTHGIPRFFCSLCNEKFTTASIARLHMKSRHSIQQIILVPLQADLTEVDSHEFVIKPLQAALTKDKDQNQETSGQRLKEDCSYTPDQINAIPIRQIFSSNVKCGLCNYQTKVRVNIIRHLQMHMDERMVPETAPVNPVPCLEKNEKMFDKMINLAASSITKSTGRMGGSAKEKEEQDNCPEFVPSHRRYVCCAQGCSYLCPEEANLKHHLMALHGDERDFTCAHCKVKLANLDIDTVMKHFKLHGLHVYKCAYCNFVHHLKHKIEKHLEDLHTDKLVRVITIRSLDAEPLDTKQQQQQMIPNQDESIQGTSQTSKFKPWNCCMCKAKYFNKEEVQAHILKKHNIDTQYKCTLCTFKNDEESALREHFSSKHALQKFDIILMYQKLEEEVPKTEATTPFDTTPLWQRDKPRVRHIRGILFDEISPEPSTKSPKKPIKIQASTSGPVKIVSPVKEVSSGLKAPSQAAKGNVSKNLFDCIEAVARGTAETLKSYEEDEKSINLIKNYNVVEVAQPTGVIVIDSDNSDEEKDELFGKVMDRGTKRTIKESSPKNAKIMKKHDDPNLNELINKCEKENLIKQYGAIGAPNSKLLQCPKCFNFKRKDIGDFVYHLYKEFKVFRYRCKICNYAGISLNYMMDHLMLHTSATEDTIEPMPVDITLDTWIHMVIREQCLIMMKTPPVIDSNQLKHSLDMKTDWSCYFCPETFMLWHDCCEHMFSHWTSMPYACEYCLEEFYTEYNLKHHHEITHPNAKLIIQPKGPTLAKALEMYEKVVKRNIDSRPMTSNVTMKKSKLDEYIFTLKNEERPTDETEADLMIVSKTDITHLSNEDDVYACEGCARLYPTESDVLKHVSLHHPHRKTKYHILSKAKSELESVSKLACNICDEVFSELKLRQHFLDNHSTSNYTPYRVKCNLCLCKSLSLKNMKIHFHRKHPLEKFDCTIKVPPLKQKAVPKVYQCTLCKFQVTSISSTSIRWHVIHHLKPVVCNHCDRRFRYISEGSLHSSNKHPSVPPDLTTLDDITKKLTETLKIILNKAEGQEDEPLSPKAKVPGKNFAKKSTSAKFEAPVVNDRLKCYEFTEENIDFSQIHARFQLGDLEYCMDVEEMKKLVNLESYVDLSDCIVDAEQIAEGTSHL